MKNIGVCEKRSQALAPKKS